MAPVFFSPSFWLAHLRRLGSPFSHWLLLWLLLFPFMQIWIRILRSFGPPGRENFGEFPALRDPYVAAVIKIPRNMSKHFQTFPRNIQMRLLRLEAKNRVEISQRHWSVAPSTWRFPLRLHWLHLIGPFRKEKPPFPPPAPPVSPPLISQ